MQFVFFVVGVGSCCLIGCLFLQFYIFVHVYCFFDRCLNLWCCACFDFRVLVIRFLILGF